MKQNIATLFHNAAHFHRRPFLRIKLNASSVGGSAASKRMSRIRTTLDSVTKAVSSTDLISKFSRFKPASVTVAGSHAGKAQKETLTSSNPPAAATPENAMKDEGGEEKDSQRHQVGEKTPAAPAADGSLKQTMQLFHPAALSTNMDETYRTLAQHINSYFGTSAQGEEDGGAAAQPPGPQDEPVSQTLSQTSGEHVPLCSPVTEDQSIKASTSAHPPPLSENSTSPQQTSHVQAPEVAARPTPEPSTSTKKGFTHYLSYPRPSVQAFVGSYIAPLVPKFRGDAKSIAPEKDKAATAAAEEPAPEKASEKQESDEQKAQRKLLLQRERVCVSPELLSRFHEVNFSPRSESGFLDSFVQITARVSIDNRTRALVKGLERVRDIKLLTSRVEELSRHLLDFPETGGVAVKVSVLVRPLNIPHVSKA